MFLAWAASIVWACIACIVASLAMESQLHGPDLILFGLLYGAVFLLTYVTDVQTQVNVAWQTDWSAWHLGLTRFYMCNFFSTLIVGLSICLTKWTI